MNKRVFLGFLCVAALAAFGCDDTQSVDTNESEEIQSYTFSVKVDQTVSGSVDLAEMSDKVVEIEVAGAMSRGVSIADVIAKVNNIESDKLAEYLSLYMCEYEGRDGFKPSDKGDRCRIVSCSEAVRSYIHVDSHGIFYAADTPMANVGCYNVSDAVSVLMYAKDGEQTGGESGSGENGGNESGSGESGTTEDYYIDIVVDGAAPVTVNATELANGSDSVSVAALFEAAGVSVELSSARCEAQVIDREDASNSFYPSAKDNCKEWLTCDVMAAGSISLEASTINYSASLSGCYSPKGMNTIAVKTTE